MTAIPTPSPSPTAVRKRAERARNRKAGLTEVLVTVPTAQRARLRALAQDLREAAPPLSHADLSAALEQTLVNIWQSVADCAGDNPAVAIHQWEDASAQCYGISRLLLALGDEDARDTAWEASRQADARLSFARTDHA